MREIVTYRVATRLKAAFRMSAAVRFQAKISQSIFLIIVIATLELLADKAAIECGEDKAGIECMVGEGQRQFDREDAP